MEQKLNLPKLRMLIKNGMQAIPRDDSAHEAIIVVGDTGVGKSTIMNYLAGNKLVVRSEGLKPKLVTEGPSVIIKIGHDKLSETSIPTRVIIQNLAFYDCPGFRDNKGEEYEISNSFFVQGLLDMYEKVKIVLMIDESHISEARVDKLPRLTKNLLRSFKSFHDIKQGVILIINRADVDLSLQDYHREIRKLMELKNQKGDLFGEEQQDFLRYLVENDRVKLFQTPLKKDKGTQFLGSHYEKDIMVSIRNSDFVKSRHISNIVSQSAKIAIRDFIDEVTIKSNAKIQKIAICVGEKAIKVFNAAGKQIPKLLQIKQGVLNLAQEIRNQQGPNIFNIIKRQIPNYDLVDFQYDFESIMFFKGIYDKTGVFFSNLINKTYAELSIVLNRLDAKILKYQKQQQEELQRQRLALRRMQIQNQRVKQRFATMQQLRKIQNMRNKLAQQSRNLNLTEQMEDTMNIMNSLEHQFVNFKSDTSKLQIIGYYLNEEYRAFKQQHIKSAIKL